MNLRKYFEYEHLRHEQLRIVSKKFADLAYELEDMLGTTEEAQVGLRKLLEAKDCFVRAALETLDEDR